MKSGYDAGIVHATYSAASGSPLMFADSAYHDAELIQRAEADHVIAYLLKPIGQADLAPAIAVAMRRFQELQLLRKEARDLKQTLADRKTIEQAKGILMKVTGVEVD